MPAEPIAHPSLIPRHPVDPRQELPALELAVLERWRERAVFERSLEIRARAPRWRFYEGPPTANGRPGTHHVLSRVFKDVYPRYKTMQGFRVERKGGWDCHGLPVEIAVEQELGIRSKADIEAYGIGPFNERCRASVFAYLEDWNALTERIGFWLDLDDAYRTLDETYIESVWWALAQIHAKGLFYESNKVVPYCPRCQTTLSSHEVALGYKDIVDPSIYVRLPVSRPAGPLEEGDQLLIWTTTPWTLPGNVAVAANPEVEYVRARRASGEDVYVLAGALAGSVLGAGVQILERFPGAEILGARYECPIFPLADRAPAGAPVIPGAFVSTEDGTGLVHIAPAFGQDDFEVAAASPEVAFEPSDPSTIYNPVRADGTFDGRVSTSDGRSLEGRFVKDPALAAELIADLDRRGLLFERRDYEHSYPHCWRCDTPLIYYAKASWYIATSRLRDRLLASNETVAWYPPHVKHGRFGKWLEGNVDWALSRERYWGTPLPVWRCPNGHIRVIGSFAELARLSGRTLADHHRPFVDDIELPCPDPACEHNMKRVPEVIDVWFDSGSMPFAQFHHPFEAADELGEDEFSVSFPADFICEAQDQTRGWFYSLLAISTLLFDTSSYRNVVCLGLILDAEGQKMSKSRGNTVEPWHVIDSYGADALRWYFFTSKAPWDGYRFSLEAVGEGIRLFLKQLWNTYFFYALFADANRARLQRARAGAAAPERSGATGGADRANGEAVSDLDRWALSRTAATAELVTQRLDDYDVTSAGRAIAELVDDLSNWYIRRSRRRFWDGEPTAFQTLRTCLLTVAKLLAPLCPFIADEIYDNLDGRLASVHLCDFPTATDLPARDAQLERAMAIARETVRLGLGARGKAKIKLRQPLAEAVVVAAGTERDCIEQLAEIVREELNVSRLRFVAAADELGHYELKANYRTLGPTFGRDMPAAAAAIAALDPGHVAASLREGAAIGISVAGRDHTLAADDILLTLHAPDGYSVEREASHAVALDLTIDADLLREGRAREIVHAVQNARKEAGLEVTDRVELVLSGDPALLEAAREHSDYLVRETLATTLEIGEGAGAGPGDHVEQTTIDGLQLTIGLRRARGELRPVSARARPRASSSDTPQ